MAESNPTGGESSDGDKVTFSRNRGHNADGVLSIDGAWLRVYPYHTRKDIIVVSDPPVKYWEGGQLPLDYIKVLYNRGNVIRKTCPHWHYMTYGFSDLHGDGRMHRKTSRCQKSGFGFELTFRLPAPDGCHSKPPQWPVELLHNLSRYIFNTGVELKEFDFIPWPNTIDKSINGDVNDSARGDDHPLDSNISNMVTVEDPEVIVQETPNGTIQFLQVVGLLENEYSFAKSWKCYAVIDQLLDHPEVGPMLITNVTRELSIFDVRPALKMEFTRMIKEEGSELGQSIAHFAWVDMSRTDQNTEENENPDEITEVDAVILNFDTLAAEVLLFVVLGRLEHGKAFRFTSVGCPHNANTQSLYFIPANSDLEGVFVSEATPMKKKGKILQIFCRKEVVEKMSKDFSIRNIKNICEVGEHLPLKFVYERPQMQLIIDEFHPKDDTVTGKTATKVEK